MKIDAWTGKECVALEDVIALLNEIVELDPVLVRKLIFERFPCNHKIRDHETIQSHCYGDARWNEPQVSILGILNGMFGVDRNKFGGITADVDIETKRVKRFMVTPTARFDKKEE